jgi:uncharacterized protein involved in exopolysaccharide biosynthesis
MSETLNDLNVRSTRRRDPSTQPPPCTDWDAPLSQALPRHAPQEPADPRIGARDESGFRIGDDVLSTVRLLLQRRRLIVVLTLIAVVAGGVRGYLAVPQYEASVLLLPSRTDRTPVGLGQFAGLASSFGVNLGVPSVSVAYPDIIQSRRVQERVLDRKYDIDEAGSVTLQEYFCPTDMPPLEMRAAALGNLGARVRVGVDKQSGVIRLSVNMPEPKLAVAVAEAFVQELIRVEERMRVDVARYNKEFISHRLSEASVALQIAENALKLFRDQNVRLGGDPELLLQAARLEREMRIQEEIYLTLTQQHELAKLEEERQHVGIQVIDPAKEPFHRSSPILLRRLMLSGFLGFIAASVVVIAYSWWGSGRRQLHPFSLSQ